MPDLDLYEDNAGGLYVVDRERLRAAGGLEYDAESTFREDVDAYDTRWTVDDATIHYDVRGGALHGVDGRPPTKLSDLTHIARVRDGDIEANTHEGWMPLEDAHDGITRAGRAGAMYLGLTDYPF